MSLPSPSEGPTLFLALSQLGWFPFLPVPTTSCATEPAGSAVRTGRLMYTLPYLVTHLCQHSSGTSPCSGCSSTLFPLVVTKPAKHKQQSHPCTPASPALLTLFSLPAVAEALRNQHEAAASACCLALGRFLPPPAEFLRAGAAAPASCTGTANSRFSGSAHACSLQSCISFLV